MLRFLFILLFSGIAAAQVAVPPLKARVTDLTGTLSSQQRAALEQTLAEFESRKGAQVAVLMVPTTQPETIEQFAVRVQEAWKLGRKGVDDGVLLVVAKNDRKLKIEVGYGLEGALPDAIAKRIIEEDIVPRFKEGDFYGGVRGGADRIMRVIEGESLPPPRPHTPPGRPAPDLIQWLFIAFFVSAIAAPIAARIFGQLGGAGVVGGLLGTFAAVFGGSLVLAFIVAIVAFFVILLISLSPSSAGWGSGGGSGWSSGGGSWGGGGFSGGGGSSGGGGASGSW